LNFVTKTISLKSGCLHTCLWKVCRTVELRITQRCLWNKEVKDR